MLKWFYIAVLMILFSVLILNKLVTPHGPGQSPRFQITKIEAEAEWIEIQNMSDHKENIGGWMILSLGKGSQPVQAFWFPAVCSVPAGGVVIVHSSGDINKSEDSCGQKQINLYWDISKIGSEVWSNKNDTACLLDKERQTVSHLDYKKGTGKCRGSYRAEKV